MSNETVIVLSLFAFTFSLVSLVLSCIGLSVIVGLKNSTHKVEWKTYDPFKEADAELAEPELPLVNPNKIKNNLKISDPFPPVAVEEEPFIDLDDPNQTSNEW
jgi:hypothetical protein